MNKLIVSKISKRKWEVQSNWITPLGSIVLKGFISNGANVPRILWMFYTPSGALFEASILHDYLYDNAIVSKSYADNLFKRTILYYNPNINSLKLKIIVQLVRWFGKGNY